MDSAFFITSKLFGIALKVETWLLIGMILCLLGQIFIRRRLAIWSGSITLAIFLAVAVFPIGELALQPLEAEYPPRAAPAVLDGIVVLGGVEDAPATAHWGQSQMNQAAERLTASAALAIQHPEARIVFSGGSGRLRDIVIERESRANVAEAFYTSFGIQPSRITWENKSRNTAENAIFSYGLVSPDPGETWILVTSAFHMGRALASYKAAGWQKISPYP